MNIMLLIGIVIGVIVAVLAVAFFIYAAIIKHFTNF